MNFRLAKIEDLDEILSIYASARRFMSEVGNPDQWGKVNPPRQCTIEDIISNKLYVASEDNSILAVFFFDVAEDPTYATIYNGNWLNNKPYGVIHRIAVSDSARGRGIAGACFDYAFAKCGNLKIDTHKDNVPMQKALAKQGFVKCGIIYLAHGDERIAYQKSEEYNEHQET